MITMGQQPKLSQITKEYITVAFIVNIDSLFADSLPQQVKDNTAKINSNGGLKLAKDYNKTKVAFKRLINAFPKRDWRTILNEIMNL